MSTAGSASVWALPPTSMTNKWGYGDGGLRRDIRPNLQNQTWQITMTQQSTAQGEVCGVGLVDGLAYVSYNRSSISADTLTKY